ncbi:glycosyl hydrolase family 15 [Lentzea atacamensis]|uniref:Glycosyl hydrolase family 15 n=1 Tax=Lentzea atacamensis TaxID=531938 RepID=A0A316HQ18_9PSEU|nr:glycosyl hydrolase family 15 [Lentzea atacamensis]
MRRSALTLRALCHRDTGAVLAAATTSLPEQIGGVRNWDYRYCWLRDAAGDRQPPGLRGSGPVRVGDLADTQVQLDVFGPITDLVHDLSLSRGSLGDRDWDVVTVMVRAVAARWSEPDHGIWEERHVPRHRVYSRGMCWQTLDRAIALAARFRRSADPDRVVLRDKIAADVGRRAGAEELFESLVRLTGPTGLLPESTTRSPNDHSATTRRPTRTWASSGARGCSTDDARQWQCPSRPSVCSGVTPGRVHWGTGRPVGPQVEFPSASVRQNHAASRPSGHPSGLSSHFSPRP